ncbi:MAG: hypothetical protein GC145_16250 [Caulobacter sp.]|nr:hypothetical protein [Caulobacter sp.]
MRKLAVMAAGAALGLAALAGPAMADPMASAYGNTVVVTYPGDATVKIYVNADGTYTGVGPDGSASGGSWKIEGDQTCFTQTTPAAGPPSCSPTVEKKVGDTWTATGQGGAPVTITIVEGR